MEMALASDCQPAELATCSVCFREFRLDERGRLFRHVRHLGFNDRCEGSRFEPAGRSLYGTRWAIDQLVGRIQKLEHEGMALVNKPLLDGIGPFDGTYEALWYQAQHFCELKLKTSRYELEHLSKKLEEWVPHGPILGPDSVHLIALWKCRAGTSVPLCFSGAESRPRGEPILITDIAKVSCQGCIEQFHG